MQKFVLRDIKHLSGVAKDAGPKFGANARSAPGLTTTAARTTSLQLDVKICENACPEVDISAGDESYWGCCLYFGVKTIIY